LQYKIPVWHRKGQCWKVEWQFGIFFLYDVFSRLAYKCAVNFSPFPNSHLDFFKGFPNPNAPKAILFM
jgi:hypothetical protein